MRRFTRFLPLFALLVACSSSSSSEPAAPTAGCPEGLPATLSISEGGRAVLDARDGVTFEGVGGVTVTTDGARVLVRAPYGTSADAAVQASCGATIPVAVRPLSWTKLASWTEDTGAKAREYGAAWIDDSGAGAFVVFGGFHYVPKQFTPANDAWRFDFAGAKWTELTGTDLPTLPGGRAAPIPGERAVYYFGGTEATADGSLAAPPSLFRLDYDDASLRAAKSDEIAGAPGSYTGAFVYDSKRKRWLSVCGLDATVGFNCDVHEFVPGKGFALLTPKGKAPTGRDGFHYAYDEETDRVVFFGGQNGYENLDIDGETWALELSTDPPEWKRLFANGEGPTKRRNGAFALDPIGHRLFVWGGTPDGKTSVKGIQVLSLDRGAEAWSSVDSEAPSRTSGIAAYDGARERIVMGFGNSPAPIRDLWALDLANVTTR